MLNTSFNVKGEPIVETPNDAVNCFLSTGMDYLAMHDMLVAKKRAHKIISPVFKAGSEIAALIRTAMILADLRSSEM